MFKRLLLGLAVALLCASAHAQQASQIPPAKACFTGTVGQTGAIAVIGSFTPGFGGTAGTYSASLLGGTGSGAMANITVTAGSVTALTLTNPGTGYVAGDVLTVSPASVGGVLGYSGTVTATALSGSLGGGSVAFYVPGTTTPKSTWQDAAATILNTNPIALDGNGCALIYGSGVYRQIVKDNLGNIVWDQPTTANGVSSPTPFTFTQTDAHAQPRSALSKMQETVSVTDWIPAGTDLSVTDVSVYFQYAATDACARSPNGLHILIPAGYYIAHDVNNSCSNLWEGAGPGGVGSANQTAVGSIAHGGTMINYSGAVAYFMRWQPANFPAFRSGAHLNGGGIKELTLNDGTSTKTALISNGTQDWIASHLVLNGAYNGIFMKGDEFPVTTHISMWGTRNKNYEIVGDLSGLTATGAVCSPSNGDCSTRNDAWYGDYLNNIDNLQTNTVFTITGFVATTTLSHTTGEGPANGMVVSCPAGMDSALSQCPGFGRMDDIQIENFKFKGVSLTDYSDFIFTRLYAVGDGSANTINAFYASSLNYSSVNIGALTVRDGKLFAVSQDCAVIAGTQYGVSFDRNNVYSCNLANNNFSGLNFSGALQDVKVNNNTIGQVNGYGGPFPLAHAIVLSSGVFNGVVSDNILNASGGVGYATWNGTSYTQVSPIADASTNPQQVHFGGNIGPGSLPVPSSCGTSPGISAGYQDSDFVVQTGSGVGTTCNVTFGTIQPVTPVCTVSFFAGANTNAAISSISVTGFTLSAGSSLSGAYSFHCSTIGK